MPTNDSFLRLADVLKVIPVSRATWYAGVKSGRYPTPVKLGLRAVGWLKSDIEALIFSLQSSNDQK